MKTISSYIYPIFMFIIAISILALALTCSSPENQKPMWFIKGERIQYTQEYINGHAGSRWMGYIPQIIFDINKYDDLNESMKWFVMAHEYCHLKNKPKYANPSKQYELEADCCSVKWLKQADFMSDGVLLEIVSEVQTWPGSEVHPTGAERASNILKCSMEE